MKSSFYSATLWVASLFLSGTATYASTASTQDLESAIEHVIVYPDSAKVTRRFHATLPAGESTLYLHYLPSGLDTSNVKTEVLKASTPAIVRDLSFENNLVKVEAHPEMLRMKSELETTESNLKEIQKQIDLLNARLTYADALTKSFTTGFGSREGELPSADTMESIWQFYEKNALGSGCESARTGG